MKEEEKSKSVSEYTPGPLVRFGLMEMQAFLPQLDSTFEVKEHECTPFSEVRLIPPLMKLIRKKKWKVLEETLLLLSKYGKHLPAISWTTIIAALDKGSLHFIHRESVFPANVAFFLSQDQRETILPPSSDTNTLTKDHDKIRSVQYYFVQHRKLQGQPWSSFWSSANAKSKKLLLTWMQKLPPDIDTDWTATLQTKGKTLQSQLKAAQHLQKGQAYQLDCDQTVQKIIRGERQIKETLNLLDISDLAIRYKKIKNEKLPLENFSPVEQYQLLVGAIMHRNIPGALHLIERVPSLLTQAPVDCPTLPPVYLSQWVSGLLLLKSPPVSWILRAFKTSDAYLTPEASQRIVDFGLRQWNEEVEVEIWTDILTWISTKGDPKVLATFLHFKEKHPFIDSSIIKTLSAITDLLYLRLQIRRGLSQ